MWTVLLGLLLIVVSGLAVFAAKKHRELRTKFASVLSIEGETERQRATLAGLQAQQAHEVRLHAVAMATAEAAHRAEQERLRRDLDSQAAGHARTLETATREHEQAIARSREALAAEREAHGQSLKEAEAAHVAKLEAQQRDATANAAAEAKRLKADISRLQQERVTAENAARARMTELETEYATAHATFSRLKAELAAVVDEGDDISYGLYRPQFAYDTPERFKVELERVWQEQKTMIRMDDATVCPHEWSVGGSRAEGRKMQKQLGKLMLRAFNGEAEAAIAKVSWNNAPKMEERIRRAAEAIDALGTVIGVRLSTAYTALAIRELRLTHELERKKQQIAEEQREIRERMREEEKAQREAARAEEEAAKEESRYEKALTRARADMERAKGAEVGELQEKIAMLEKSLAEAHAQKERAKSMAEQTRAGHVYIISNLGSFGENVFKIGMTRRLDPADRVRELGDASVPFEFDIHAMVYTEDAPGLENEFHRQFADRRVNLVNPRKEFFQIPLNEIAGFVNRRGLKLDLTMLAEAREYRESTALRAAAATAAAGPPGGASATSSKSSFPQSLSGSP